MNRKAEPTPLERSHDDLRGALIFAARTIRKLRCGRELPPPLAGLLKYARSESREALRHARALRRRDGSDDPETARELNVRP